ncbi:hypothetical protein BJX62DRAFT_201863 [Aspergillus germanicus]
MAGRIPSCARTRLRANNPHISSLLTTHELEITTAPTPEILRRLQRGTWITEATVTAFCKRAALARQAMNCVTDIFFDEAINTARGYDEYFRSNRGEVTREAATIAFKCIPKKVGRVSVPSWTEPASPSCRESAPAGPKHLLHRQRSGSTTTPAGIFKKDIKTHTWSLD